MNTRPRNMKINRFLKLCLDMAEIVDSRAEINKWTEAHYAISTGDVGLGYRAWSMTLREGVRSIIDVLDELHEARLNRHLDSLPDDEEDSNDAGQD